MAVGSEIGGGGREVKVSVGSGVKVGGMGDVVAVKRKKSLITF